MDISDFPARIVVELTPLCNLDCDMCPRHIIEKHNGFMGKRLWEKLIDEIACYEDKIVLPFWRGESLLHPNFIEFSKYVSQKGLKLHISTNGLLLNEKNSQTLSRYEFITFSIHTALGFEKAKEFVQKYKNKDNTIQISFVDCEDKMMPFLEKTINDKNLFGFDSVRLYEEHTKDGLFGHSKKEIKQTRFFCPTLNHTLVIAYDGSISRCNHIWNTEEYNLSQTSIKEAWGSEVMQNIRKNYPDNFCQPCDQWSGNTNGKVWMKEKSMIKGIGL